MSTVSFWESLGAFYGDEMRPEDVDEGENWGGFHYRARQFLLITLADGERFEHSWSERTDEGAMWGAVSFRHAGDRVVRSDYAGGSDCDGRAESSSDGFCLLSRLGSRRGPGGIRLPDWEPAEDGEGAR